MQINYTTLTNMCAANPKAMREVLQGLQDMAVDLVKDMHAATDTEMLEARNADYLQLREDFFNLQTILKEFDE